MHPSKDDFTRWLDDPVTRWVLAAHKQIAEDCHTEWDRYSWENGGSNPTILQELRVRADTYRAIAETTYEGFCETLGDKPSAE